MVDGIVCQLCGVAFAIARLRQTVEPPEAAWGWERIWHYTADSDEYCGAGSGCELIEHDINGRLIDGVMEHAAGPGCISHCGYSGQWISVEEMKGCCSMQCLVQKGSGWQPEPNDQDFELESDYFVTGVHHNPPDEGPLVNLTNVRHGTDHFEFGNLTVNDHTFALPFHPSCFEIFKKVSKSRLGSVDVDGLWYWRALEGSPEEFFENFPCKWEVKTGYHDFWNHEPGSEYLAANPIEIPGFAALVRRLKRSTDFKTNWNHHAPTDPSHTNYRMGLPPKSSENTYPFSKMPSELSDMVLAYLSSKDIANLRLASPVFRKIPIILFRRLLLDDMPWFWEARDFPVRETNWYEVYRKVQSWTFKGLQNRKRIWKDVEVIVRRIEKYRQEGKVGFANRAYLR